MRPAARLDADSTGRTSSRTRRTSSTSTCSAAAGRRSRRGSCSRRRSRRRTASTPASSSFENVPVRAGQRGVPRLGEVRGEEARARRAAAAARRAAERERGARTPALQRLDNVTFLETENEQLFALPEAHGRQRVIVVVNLDPTRGAGGRLHPPGRDSACRPRIRVRDLLAGDADWTWHIGRNYVRLEPGQSHVLEDRRR